MLLGTRFFLAALLSISVLAPRSLSSYQPSLTGSIAVALSACSILTDWGALTSFTLHYQYGLHALERPVVNNLLPPFFSTKSAKKYGWHGHAICVVSIIIDLGQGSEKSLLCRLADLYGKSIVQGMAATIVLCGAHAITYSLAKRALQWHIDRSYQNVPNNREESEDDISAEPIILESLQKEALFSAALEKDTRDNYSKIPEKDRRTCPICYETISPENLHMTCCKQKQSYATHYYCEECINAWKKTGNNSCPQCKGTML